MHKKSTPMAIREPQRPGARRASRQAPPAIAPAAAMELDDDTVVDPTPKLVDLMRQGPCARSQVARWIGNGVDADAADGSGTTALMLAASRGVLDVVTYLVGRGVAVNSMDARGYTAFAMAVTSGRHEVAAYLKSRGANPNVVAPLFDMARSGRLQALRAFAFYGTQMELRDRGGNTALISAAAAGQLLVVSFLLSQGADPSLRNGRGVDALTSAVAGGHFRVAALLETGRDAFTTTSLRYLRYRLQRWRLN